MSSDLPRSLAGAHRVPGAESVPVQSAATVMLVRDAAGAAGGVEVLMLRRTQGAVFAGGFYVFPGGRVDAVDGAGIDAASRVAAIRECFEESGVLLALDASGTPVGDDHPAMVARHEVSAGRVDFLDLCRDHGLTPDLGGLAYVSRWVTPVGPPRRFDTRFYVALAPASQTSSHDDTETVDSLWVRPADALAREASGELKMLPPTTASLRFLAAHATAREAYTAALAIVGPARIMPTFGFDADGKVIELHLPDDAGPR